MARKRVNWGNIVEGEVVSFRYKGKKAGAKSRNRTCLILNSKHMYKRKKEGKKVRLVHALQLKAVPKISGTRELRESQLKKILNKSGNVKILDEGTEDERYALEASRGTSRKQYRSLKNVISTYGIYRTFSWVVLRANAVFRDEEFTWPEDIVKELQKVKPIVDEEDL